MVHCSAHHLGIVYEEGPKITEKIKQTLLLSSPGNVTEGQFVG